MLEPAVLEPNRSYAKGICQKTNATSTSSVRCPALTGRRRKSQNAGVLVGWTVPTREMQAEPKQLRMTKIPIAGAEVQQDATLVAKRELRVVQMAKQEVYSRCQA